MTDTQKEELKELKKQSEKKGTYISIFMSMGIIGAGLSYTLYDNKIGMAVIAAGIIPLIIKPETMSGNKKKNIKIRK